jgi:hypothetical protein
LAFLGQLLIPDAPDELRQLVFDSENRWTKAKVEALEAAYLEYAHPVVQAFRQLSCITMSEDELQGETFANLPVEAFFSGEVEEDDLDERFHIANFWRAEALDTAENLRDRLKTEVITAPDNEETHLMARCLLAHAVIVALEKEIVNFAVPDRCLIEDLVSHERFSPEQLELVEAGLTPAEECLGLELAVPIFQELLGKLDLD